jgi:hypothetical protein
MIKIKVAPWQVYQAVYNCCRPVGMGFLQYTPGDMSDSEAKEIIAGMRSTALICMDYVGGRQCKFSFKVESDPAGCVIDDAAWYDHSKGELDALIAHLISLEA